MAGRSMAWAQAWPSTPTRWEVCHPWRSWAWGMAVAVNAREPSRLRAPLIALVVAGICYLPWLTVLLGQARAVLSSFWASPPSVISPLASLYVFFQGPFANPAWMPLALTAVLAPLALTVYALTRHPGPDPADLSFLWAWLALPLLALLLFSVVRSVYLERVVIGASFPVYLLLGWAAARLQPRALGLALAAAVLCSAGAGLTLWFTDAAYGKPPLRAAAATVSEAWQEGSPGPAHQRRQYAPLPPLRARSPQHALRRRP